MLNKKKLLNRVRFKIGVFKSVILLPDRCTFNIKEKRT